MITTFQGTSMTRRLILASLMWIVVGVVLASFALSKIFRTQLDGQFRDELAMHVEELEEMTTFDSSGQIAVMRPLSDPRYDVKQSGFYWEISRDEVVLARSPSLVESILSTPPDTREDGTLHYHTVEGPTGQLILAEKSYARADGTVRFMVGGDRRHIKALMRSFNTVLGWSMGLFAASLAAAAGLLLLVALRPLQQLRGDLTSVRTGAATRLTGAYPLELVPLVDDMNAMLEATADSVQKARARAGNLAHGLKTPLAILTDEGYALQRAGLSAAADTIFDQCRRMRVHIDYQLARARAAAMKAVPGTVADAKSVIENAAAALSRMHKDRGVSIMTDVPSDCRTACDAQDLNEMVANLLDNACKHAVLRVRVSGRVDPSTNSVRFEVDDDGPGLPDEALEVVFNIGERWDSRAHGSGLGLPIVQELSQIYGGSIKLSRSELGGLRAALVLPAAPKS